MSQFKDRYAGEVFHADAWIGDLVDAFDARRGRSDAIVLLTADHGESFGETPQILGHTLSSTPNVAHVPMILRAPGLAPGRRPEIVHHVDVMPTLLDLAGLAVPTGASGVALGRVLRDGASLPERYVYCDNGIELAAYRGAEFVLVGRAAGAWGTVGAGAKRGAQRPSKWDRYAWTTSSEWTAAAEGAQPIESLPEAVAAYMGDAVPMFVPEPLSDEKRKQLEALGYVDTD